MSLDRSLHAVPFFAHDGVLDDIKRGYNFEAYSFLIVQPSMTHQSLLFDLGRKLGLYKNQTFSRMLERTLGRHKKERNVAKV